MGVWSHDVQAHGRHSTDTQAKNFKISTFYRLYLTAFGHSKSCQIVWDNKRERWANIWGYPRFTASREPGSQRKVESANVSHSSRLMVLNTYYFLSGCLGTCRHLSTSTHCCNIRRLFSKHLISYPRPYVLIVNVELH